jgi:hypothetical protein
MARFAAVDVFPTPPVPETMAILLVMARDPLGGLKYLFPLSFWKC